MTSASASCEIDDDDVGHSLLSFVDEPHSDGAYSEALSDGRGGCELVSERELLGSCLLTKYVIGFRGRSRPEGGS
jgi:hypothetical protein